MTGRRVDLLLFFAALYASAFVLNFCWESMHGLLYRDHQELAASVYVPMMARMAGVDALSVVGVYLFTALLSGALVWKPGWQTFLVFFLVAIIPSWAVEYVAVTILAIWSYTSAMPVLLTVGLTPLLQIPLTGLLSVLIAYRTGYGSLH